MDNGALNYCKALMLRTGASTTVYTLADGQYEFGLRRLKVSLVAHSHFMEHAPSLTLCVNSLPSISQPDAAPPCELQAPIIPIA